MKKIIILLLFLAFTTTSCSFVKRNQATSETKSPVAPVPASLTASEEEVPEAVIVVPPKGEIQKNPLPAPVETTESEAEVGY